METFIHFLWGCNLVELFWKTVWYYLVKLNSVYFLILKFHL